MKRICIYLQNKFVGRTKVLVLSRVEQILPLDLFKDSGFHMTDHREQKQAARGYLKTIAKLFSTIVGSTTKWFKIRAKFEQELPHMIVRHTYIAPLTRPVCCKYLLCVKSRVSGAIF